MQLKEILASTIINDIMTLPVVLGEVLRPSGLLVNVVENIIRVYDGLQCVWKKLYLPQKYKMYCYSRGNIQELYKCCFLEIAIQDVMICICSVTHHWCYSPVLVLYTTGVIHQYLV